MANLETIRFELPLLATGQAHKELFHNEAITRIDFLIHPTVLAVESDPTQLVPVSGQSWLVGPSATNEWQGHDDQIASWSGNGWLFITPLALMRIYIESIDNCAVYRGSWQVSDTVETPTGGAVIDSEARLVIESILSALETQGILKVSS